jgi:hypothetical protein
MLNNSHIPAGQFDPVRSVPAAAPREFGAGIRRAPSRAVRLCWPGIVRLPGAQPLLLRRIERSLLAEDFRLDSEFAIFARSARGQEMPSTEQVGARSRALRAAALATVGLAAAGGAVVLSWLIANQLANLSDSPSDPITGRTPRTGPAAPRVMPAGRACRSC